MLYHLLNASILFIQPVYDWFNDEYSLTGLYVLLMPYLWGLITILGAIFVLVRSLLEIFGRQSTRWFDPLLVA